MARSRSGLSLRRGRNKSKRHSTLDAVIYQWYAALLAAISAGIGLGGLRQEDKKRSSRSPQRTPARMETAKATATASSTAPRRSRSRSNRGPPNRRAQNRNKPGDALSPFSKKTKPITYFPVLFIGHFTPFSPRNGI